MMAYENNNHLNNAPFVDCFDPFEQTNIEGKLAAANMNGLAAQLQPGYIQQCNNNVNHAQQQMNNLANLQMQMNSQVNFNNNMNNTMNNMHNTMNGFQATTLMNSMVMQQPFFQTNFQQQQQARNVPSFISFQNDNGMHALTPKPLLEPTGTLGVPSIINTNKVFGNLEPLPVVEKSQQVTTNDPIKAPSASLSYLPRSISKSKRLLPVDFQPCGNYVICGNKRKFFESKGNIRFRNVCKLFLQEYVQAPTKIEKSAVVTKVMNILREDCPEGAFVSPQGGRWYAVSERTAREKVGTFFRDCLSDSYKSSAKNKIARRKIIKKANAHSANNSSRDHSESNHSDDGSLGSISFYDVDDLTPVPL